MSFKLSEGGILKLSSNNNHSKKHISFVPRNKLFTNWTNDTLTSPLYQLSCSNHTFPNYFKQKWFITFFYLLNPKNLFSLPNLNLFKIYLSYGLSNVVVIYQEESFVNELKLWANKKGIIFETWRVLDGKIIQSERSSIKNHNIEIKSLIKIPKNKIVRVVYEEYFATQKSLITSINIYMKEFLNDFLNLHETVIEYIEQDEHESEEVTEFLIGINAGLSRLLSQTFSTAVSINNSYCAIRNHSLLGIGLANIGLMKTCKFIDEIIGKKFIADLFESLGNYTNINVEDLYHSGSSSAKSLADVSKKEFLNKGKLKEKLISIPALSFFSARDGFKSGNRISVSAPLLSINGCNTYHWNLITITHELSHLQIRTVLPYLKPNSHKEEEKMRKIISNPDTTIKTLLDYAKYLFVESIFCIQQVDKYEIDFDEITLINSDTDLNFSDEIMTNVDEILTHIFDFLYFYDGNIRNYMYSIWSSWIAIPYIEDRIEDYIIRSATTMLSSNLSNLDYNSFLNDQLKKIFSDLYSNLNHRYLKLAIDKIENDEDWKRIYNNIIARLDLILLCRSFLYSTSLGGIVNKEINVYPGRGTKGGYDLKVNTFSIGDINISNPIHFFKYFCKDKKISSTKSLWIWNQLSFSEIKQV